MELPPGLLRCRIDLALLQKHQIRARLITIVMKNDDILKTMKGGSSTMTSATGLKRLYRSNATAKMLLDHFASRDRNREITNFNRILKVLMDEGDEAPTRARLREVFR